jgi:hypothetical protein
MKFSDVADALMAGKRVRKTNWEDSTAYVIYESEYNTFDFYMMSDGEIYKIQSYTTLDLTPKDLMSDDWEVME